MNHTSLMRNSFLQDVVVEPGILIDHVLKKQLND